MTLHHLTLCSDPRTRTRSRCRTRSNVFCPTPSHTHPHLTCTQYCTENNSKSPSGRHMHGYLLALSACVAVGVRRLRTALSSLSVSLSPSLHFSLSVYASLFTPLCLPVPVSLHASFMSPSVPLPHPASICLPQAARLRLCPPLSSCASLSLFLLRSVLSSPYLCLALSLSALCTPLCLSMWCRARRVQNHTRTPARYDKCLSRQLTHLPKATNTQTQGHTDTQTHSASHCLLLGVWVCACVCVSLAEPDLLPSIPLPSPEHCQAPEKYHGVSSDSSPCQLQHLGLCLSRGET